MNADELIASRKFFSAVNLWPSQPLAIDPKGWLSNFRVGVDTDIACALLESFIFFNRDQTTKLCHSAFHSLSALIETEAHGSDPEGANWMKFRGSAYVSYPTGKDDDPTASGRIFVREARDSLVAEDQIFDPNKLVEQINSNAEPVDVVLMDDFAGTGHQLVDSWLREIKIDGEAVSMNSLYQDHKIRSAYYVPAVSTAYAMRFIKMNVRGMTVKPAHILPDEYMANPDFGCTTLVPSHLVGELESFLERYAFRAGYSKDRIYGYGHKGLALAFQHSIPDATLPIFYSENAGWKTLRRRS